MASIVFRKTKNETDPDQQRRKGMVEAGRYIADLIDTEAGKASPVFDANFAKAVVLGTLKKYISDRDYEVDYMGQRLSVTSNPDRFAYTDPTTSGPDEVQIIPVADERVRKMSVAVPIPATPGLSVLEGYGEEVLRDLKALSTSSGGTTAEAQKYFLATVMFRRCR